MHSIILLLLLTIREVDDAFSRANIVVSRYRLVKTFGNIRKDDTAAHFFTSLIIVPY